ncbi:MAG: class I SAM-dependent methyltransferase [Candidatus Scalindua sp.]|nr:class I SAM-dependent methyltransferase [Candidatus Scalindua sp.]MBT6227764.1 class I SAM-dependent methyltransferase [Candidatus Scalindua sp.]
MKNVVRKADESVYLAEDRLEKPKDTQQFIVSLFERSFKTRLPESVLDIGCAAGEFLYLLKKRFPKCDCYGIDTVESLIKKAKENVANVSFKTHSIFDTPYYHGKTFDAVFCLGVVSIFDDIERVLKCILSSTKKGSLVYISGIFNPEPVDALIVYRNSTTDLKEPWQSGWNNFSQQTVNTILDPMVRSYTWRRHKMPFMLPKQVDPMRTWTVKTEGDQFQRINGIGLLYDLWIVEIEV